MLVDPEFYVMTPEEEVRWKAIMAEHKLTRDVTAIRHRHAEGVYQIVTFNGDHMFKYRCEHYPRLMSAGINPFSPYGVCDRYEQVLEQCPMLVTSDRQFSVFLTGVYKEHQEPDGGWRWEKWGPYIGTQVSKADYLYDEPEIESILVYQIYEHGILPLVERFPKKDNK